MAFAISPFDLGQFANLFKSMSKVPGAGIGSKATGPKVAGLPTPAPVTTPPIVADKSAASPAVDVLTDVPILQNVHSPIDSIPAEMPPLGEPAIKKPGMLDRIKDFMGSDEGRAALFRAGASMLQSGNVGTGLLAAAGYMDDRKAAAAKSAADKADRNLRERQVDNAYNLGLGNLAVNQEQLTETARHNRAGEDNTRYGTASENWRHSTPSGSAVISEQGRNYRHVTPSADNIVDEQGANFRHTTPSGDHLTPSGDTIYKHDNPAPATVRRTLKIHHTDQTPEQVQALRGGTHPSQVQPGGGPVQVNSDADYQALPSGTKFIAPDGTVRVKP